MLYGWKWHYPFIRRNRYSNYGNVPKLYIFFALIIIQWLLTVYNLTVDKSLWIKHGRTGQIHQPTEKATVQMNNRAMKWLKIGRGLYFIYWTSLQNIAWEKCWIRRQTFVKWEEARNNKNINLYIWTCYRHL